MPVWLQVLIAALVLGALVEILSILRDIRACARVIARSISELNGREQGRGYVDAAALDIASAAKEIRDIIRPFRKHQD